MGGLPGSGGNQEEGHIKRVAFYSHFVWQFGSRQWGSCVLRPALCPTCKAINFRFIPNCYLLNKK